MRERPGAPFDGKFTRIEEQERNVKEMDWQIGMILEAHRERIKEAECAYHVREALYAGRSGSEISIKVMGRTGSLLVGMGKRLQRRGGTPVDTWHAESC